MYEINEEQPTGKNKSRFENFQYFFKSECFFYCLKTEKIINSIKERVIKLSFIYLTRPFLTIYKKRIFSKHSFTVDNFPISTSRFRKCGSISHVSQPRNGCPSHLEISRFEEYPSCSISQFSLEATLSWQGKYS